MKEGAHIVCVDLNENTAKATAKEITDKHGLGIGVAGSGISGCGPAIGFAAGHHGQRVDVEVAVWVLGAGGDGECLRPPARGGNVLGQRLNGGRSDARDAVNERGAVELVGRFAGCAGFVVERPGFLSEGSAAAELSGEKNIGCGVDEEGRGDRVAVAQGE